MLKELRFNSQQEQVVYLSKSVQASSQTHPATCSLINVGSMLALFSASPYLKLTTHFHPVAWLISEGTTALMASTGLTLSVS
jgi:hypothetical protein